MVWSRLGKVEKQAACRLPFLPGVGHVDLVVPGCFIAGLVCNAPRNDVEKNPIVPLAAARIDSRRAEPR
eukprot:12900571-Prorocentrum_lima.AAC.1